ncbi:MAG: flagellar hook-length control protein FliK, partial [Robiginitomaculum sp.]|nr:flagellar hook-length control protein FliK [Robiginitomaculum sp.]
RGGPALSPGEIPLRGGPALSPGEIPLRGGPALSPGEIPLRGGAALSPGEIPVRTAPPPSQAALLSSAAPTIPIPASSVPSAGTPAKPATTGPKLTGAVAPISTPTNVVSLANFVSNFIPTSPQFGGDFSATTENFVDSVTASTSVNRGAVGTTNLITGVAVQASASRIGAEAVEKFAARLASRAANGSSKFEMRLDPPQLGRIEVKIEVTSDNRVQAVLSAEHPDVLQDLQRGADALRRALLAEGFDLGSNDLEFHLEQQGQDTEQQLDPEAEIDGQALAQIMDSALANQFTEIDTGYGYWLVRDVKLDIRA